MTLLIVGILLFTLVHLFPAAMKPVRDSFAERLGANLYKGLFALIILGSVVIIVFGWKAASPTLIYTPVLTPGLITSALMLVAIILFVASAMPTNLKRWIRHPQMTGTLIWSVAHLLTNGDSRSVLLFGGLGLWSIAEIVLCSNRDGAWLKPDQVPLGRDGVCIMMGIILFAAFAYFHRALFGVSVTLGLEGV